MSESTVIKPPFPHVTSGKIFRPSLRLMWKEFTSITLLCTFFWFVGVLGWLGFAYIFLVLDDGMFPMLFWNNYVPTWWPVTYLYAAILVFALCIPMFVFYPMYFRNIEYSVISKEGDSMPEIYVKKGLLNITKKHVPFRTVTNISSKAGIMDRLFGIGNVEIQTAGGHTAMQSAEEKLEGIIFYEEVRDFVLNELRKFRLPYTTTTEIVVESEPAPRSQRRGSANEEMLSLLHEIRDILNRE
jgi:membrane protein YdbS with pleckstrin-like domain